MKQPISPNRKATATLLKSVALMAVLAWGVSFFIQSDAQLVKELESDYQRNALAKLLERGSKALPALKECLYTGRGRAAPVSCVSLIAACPVEQAGPILLERLKASVVRHGPTPTGDEEAIRMRLVMELGRIKFEPAVPLLEQLLVEKPIWHAYIAWALHEMTGQNYGFADDPFHGSR